MDVIFSGITGIATINLALVGSLVAMLAFFAATRESPSITDRQGWFSLGKWAFILHGLGVIGALANLFGMILTQQYQYHYVFSHSSNELPLNYAIACLWEGQEGSFLLWMFWHAILGLIFLKTGGKWRAGVLGTVASVQLILSSMVLGAYMDQLTVKIIYTILGLVPMNYLVYRTFLEASHKPDTTSNQQFLLTIGAGFVWLFSIVNLFKDQTGFTANVVNLGQIPFLAETVFGIAVICGLIYFYIKKQISFPFLASASVVLTLAVVGWMVNIADWKVGSSPFLLLKQVRGGDPIYQVNPDFVPANGNGLNALLQNYWMVIHPPTLFLGFASTVIPFGFVIASLIQRNYKEWVKDAAIWTIFSVMILGIGIIMGGYWAYETLNFGGYWNWDPVENASLVPWLLGVGALHGMLAYRKGKTNLHFTYILVISTFILVLYSTFLTRSGVLGEASVHSFTDLGLSGQLLVLLLTYVLVIVLLLVEHWNAIPSEKKEMSFWSRDFFLTLAALTLTFCAVEVSLFTSLPVINKIIGTNYAPPPNIPFFYYKWNVWFGIAIALFSAIGQYFYWTKIEQRTLLKAISTPFILAVIALIVVLGMMFYSDYAQQSVRWQFVYHQQFADKIAKGNLYEVIVNGILLTGDELLLVCGFFTLFANGLILLRLLLKGKHNLKHLGGSLAHIGFGMMLIGILFSSGFQDTITLNLSPNELGKEFNEAEKKENVQLFRHTPKLIKGYRVEYQGIKQAEAPLYNFKVISDNGAEAKVSFEDKHGDRYALQFPTKFFEIIPKGKIAPTAKSKSNEKNYDLDKLRFFVENQIDLIQPEMLNERSLYKLKFTTLDSSCNFTVMPETELSEGMGFTPHPARKIMWDHDLYVHVTSFPSKRDEPNWVLALPDKKISVGDSFAFGKTRIWLKKVETVKQTFTQVDLIAKMVLEVNHEGKKYITYPMLMIDQNGPVMVDSHLPELGLRFEFLMALPEENKLVLRVLQKNDKPDFITINAISKPFINLLWLGTFVLTFGFFIAIIRRIREKQSFPTNSNE